MPAPKGNTGATTATSTAQGRFTIQLPGDLGARLDAIGKTMSDSVFVAARVRVDISRPDVIKSLVATYEAVTAEAAAEAAADDTGKDNTTVE